MPRGQDLDGGEAGGGGRIQVLSRAVDVLRALSGERDGLSLSVLAERTSLPRSTVHRLVTALEAEGLVSAASSSGGVRIGAELVRLADAGRHDWHTELRPVMERVFDSLEETVDLAVLDGDHMRFVEQIPAPHRLRAVSAVGATFPLHCSANGKAALSLLSDEQVGKLLPSRLSRFTPNTITSRRELVTELAEIRAMGIAFDREEHTAGISAAGIAVRAIDGTVVAMSVPAPTQRFTSNERRVIAALGDASKAARRALGID